MVVLDVGDVGHGQLGPVGHLREREVSLTAQRPEPFAEGRQRPWDVYVWKELPRMRSQRKR